MGVHNGPGKEKFAHVAVCACVTSSFDFVQTFGVVISYANSYPNNVGLCDSKYNLKCFQVMYIVVPKMYVQCQDSEVLYLVYATIWPVHGLCHILTGDGDSPLSRLNTSLLTVLVMRVTHDIISIIDLCKPALCLNKQLKFQLHVRTNDC